MATPKKAAGKGKKSAAKPKKAANKKKSAPKASTPPSTGPSI